MSTTSWSLIIARSMVVASTTLAAWLGLSGGIDRMHGGIPDRSHMPVLNAVWLSRSPQNIKLLS
jgi:hypothetical protein